MKLDETAQEHTRRAIALITATEARAPIEVIESIIGESRLDVVGVIAALTGLLIAALGAMGETAGMSFEETLQLLGVAAAREDDAAR